MPANSPSNEKDFISDSLKILRDYILLLAALVAAIKYLDSIIPQNRYYWKVVIWTILAIIVLLLYFFNIRPAQKKRRELKMRPTGRPENDYFTTSPRTQDKYQFFSHGYEKYNEWLQNPKASLLYLTGASGSGKSSLLNAWLVPNLTVNSQGIRTNIFLMRSYHDPLKQLYETLLPFVADEHRVILPNTIIAMLDEAASLLGTNEKILIILDQFEEFFLLRTAKNKLQEDPNSIGSETEIETLKLFFQLYLAKHYKNITILLSYRDDFQQFIEQLNVPARNEHINFEQLNPLPFNKAKSFLLNCPGLEIPEARLHKVMEEASTVDSPLTIRPIVLNMMGIILQRMVDHPMAWKMESNLIRQYILDGLGKEIKVERAHLIKAMLTDFNTARPRSAEELSEISGLDITNLDNQLIALNHYGLVRCLDKEEPNVKKRKWQIAHDFIALQLEKVVHGIGETFWSKMRPWIAASVGVILLLVGTYVYFRIDEWKRSDAIVNLNKVGLVWDEKHKTIGSSDAFVSRSISDSIFQSIIPSLILLQPDTFELRYLDSLTNLDGLNKVKSLKDFNIWQGFKISSIEGLKGLQNLESIFLLDCEYLENISVVQSLPSLKSLQLSDCDLLENFKPLQGHTKIEELIIERTNNVISLEGIKDLPNLSKLSLSNCYKLPSIDQLGKLPSLIELMLINCENLQRIDKLQRFPILKELYLNGCVRINDLNSLKGIKTLTRLTAANCTNLSDITALNELKSLKYIDLTKTPKVTKEAIEKLKMALPNAEVKSDF